MFTKRLNVDRWNAQYTAVCGKSKLLRGRVGLESIIKVDRASRSYCAKAKRRDFVPDSSVIWKPVWSSKMSCNVVCPRSFQDEMSCFVLNFLNSVQLQKNVSRNKGFGGLNREVLAC